MSCHKVNKKESDRRQKEAQLVNYIEMERLKPRDSAIKAFRHKPYSIGGEHSGLDRQGFEESQDRKNGQ